MFLNLFVQKDAPKKMGFPHTENYQSVVAQKKNNIRCNKDVSSDMRVLICLLFFRRGLDLAKYDQEACNVTRILCVPVLNLHLHVMIMSILVDMCFHTYMYACI